MMQQGGCGRSALSNANCLLPAVASKLAAARGRIFPEALKRHAQLSVPRLPQTNVLLQREWQHSIIC